VGFTSIFVCDLCGKKWDSDRKIIHDHGGRVFELRCSHLNANELESMKRVKDFRVEICEACRDRVGAFIDARMREKSL
jgi:predicted metal-binding protein